jgi:hypothetical protein
MNLRASLMIAATLLFGSACDSNSDTDAGTITVDVPRPDVTPTDAPTADAQSPDAAPSDVASDAAADVATDASADAATDGGMYVDGCFVGTPSTMSEILNRCGGAVAFPPRAARGSRLTADGGVQPLSM